MDISEEEAGNLVDQKVEEVEKERENGNPVEE
jgi:hypothetical protein